MADFPTVTVAMATFDDFHGIFFSTQALRMYQDMEGVNLIVLDNNPKSPDGKETASFVNSIKQGCDIEYHTFEENTGTTQTREKLFELAKGDVVMVMDCHVMLQANALYNLKDFYRKAESDMRKNLFTGPLWMDHLGHTCTHFECDWRSEMWGTWATAWRDKDGNLFVGRNQDNQLEMKALNSDGPWMQSGFAWAQHEAELLKQGFYVAGTKDDWDKPFEIPAQGLGMFISARDSWLGFNKDFRSFGGEECYIHEKYRQAGRKTFCLPWMKWNHRFGRPGGPKYPITREGKMRNYILGYQELGKDLEEVRHHFVDEIGVRPEVWEFAVNDPVAFDPKNNPYYKQRANTEPSNMQPIAKSNLGMPLPLLFESLHDVAVEVATYRRDLDTHAATLMDLASQCQHVTEMTKRRESTAFLLAGITRKPACQDEGCRTGCKRDCNTPVTMISFQEERDSLITYLQDAVKTSPGKQITWTDHATSLREIPTWVHETDMLFIDTVHSYERANAELKQFGKQVRKFIVFHDTATRGNGLKGEDGGKGILHAIREFLGDNPEWFIKSHTELQYGLTVLSKVPEHKPATPIVPWPKMMPDGTLCGPGQQLKASLKLIGIVAAEGCSCNGKALQMDAWGPDGCREHMEEILDGLKQEADARKMGHLFVRPAVKLMVSRAIRAAEKQIACGDCR